MVEKDKLKEIEDAVVQFNSKKLYESTMSLLNALDYHSMKTERLSPNTFEGFLDNFNISSKAIDKDKALVNQWKKVEFIFQISDSEITRIQSLFESGQVDANEYQSFLFFAIELKGENYKRADLVKITREINQPFKMPVIVLFQYGTKLTLSIIDRRLNKRDTSKDVLEKVTLIKDIDIENPQRAHKEILKDLSLEELYRKYEFHSFIKMHEAWKATLNISELNKKFYRELAYWYFWALNEVEFPDDVLKDAAARNPINVIRLITRLIFVWFLKEKNLVPDALFNKRELDKILDYKDKTGSTYYKAILQNLFFATLNTEMNKDVKDKDKISRTFVKRNTGIPHYFRFSKYIKDQAAFSKLMDNIPFLNGGLFECLDRRFKDNSKDIFIDGFSQQTKNEALVTVPDFLFFATAPKNIDLNETFHTKGKKYEVRGLIDILSRYKFTIEENTPVEEEVALDPELLGKVFENLLASYVEETKTTARKMTGSFYTPREIVNYMVDESLITYLTNKLHETNITTDINERLHHLFSYTNEPIQFSNEEVNCLIQVIDNCKILDPACGSGAFPMGILHKLVHILSKLDPNNKKWKQTQLEKAKRDRKRAEEEFEDEKNRETALKEIDKRIDDIESAFNTNNHELDFARKLYIIENCIYGIDKQPIAIQIAKLRFFIALIVDQKTSSLDNEHNRGIRPLPNLETKFVAANTLVGLEEKKQLTLINTSLQKQIEDKEKEIHEIRERHFRARTPETKEKYREKDTILRNELAELLEQGGYFSSKNSKRIAHWNPYDQNIAADFFYKDWMFSMSDGFSIIIGNPPYIEHKKLKEISGILKEQYETYSGTADIYVYFYEKGIKLVEKNGVLCYITSNKFIKTSYGEKLREFLIKRRIVQLIDFTEVHAFDALVASCIVITSERKADEPILVSFATDELTSFADLHEFVKKNHLSIHQSALTKEIWQLESDDRLKLKSQIEKKGKLLYEITGVNFFRGVTTGFNPAFIIGEKERKEFISLNKATKQIIKPLLQGRNIRKWVANNNGEFLLFIPWHFPLHQNPEITGSSSKAERSFKELFPEIYEHLKVHKEDLSSRNKDETGIRYEWYALQRCAASYYGEFDKLKIVWGLTADKWAFAYDEDKHFLPSNGYILTSEEVPVKYLLALLNSRILQFYFGFIGIMTAGGAYTLKHETIREMPIVIANEDVQKLFSTLVDYILFVLKADEELINGISNLSIVEDFELVLNGCIYELYFDEVKEAGLEIIFRVQSDVKTMQRLIPEKAIVKLYEKWQQSENDVRNTLLSMITTCSDTIGIIESTL